MSRRERLRLLSQAMVLVVNSTLSIAIRFLKWLTRYIISKNFNLEIYVFRLAYRNIRYFSKYIIITNKLYIVDFFRDLQAL